MIFFHILKSFDELLYELMTWLLFYPITLWRAVRHPLRMMDYAKAELERKSEEQFRATLRPPIFLFVTVIVAHLVELQAVGDSPIIYSKNGVADLINDDTSLIVLRIMAFALFPVAMAAIEARLANKPINRDGLQKPFYAQCYLAAPFALALSLASTGIRISNSAMEEGGVLFALIASALYLATETKWLTRSTGRGWLRALAAALAGFLICTLIIAGFAALLGGA